MKLAPKGRLLSQQAWDRTYKMGLWTFLHNVPEAPRYGVVSAYVRSFGKGGRVLDMGCGDAILYHYVEEFSSGYVGIDISNRAIESATVDPAKAELFVADIANTPIVDFKSVSVVVLNEVLYHVDDPMAFLRTLREELPAESVIILSMFRPSESDTRIRPIVHGIWEALAETGWPILAGVAIVDAGGTGWDIKVIATRDAL